MILRTFSALSSLILVTRGDALRVARACPWLSYFAPLALCLTRIRLLVQSRPDALYTKSPTLELNPVKGQAVDQ